MWANAVCRADIAIEGTPRWGFDGKVRIGEFNMMTLDIVNQGDQPWQGNIQVQVVNSYSGGDVKVLHPGLFIEAYGRRRLQFFLYVRDVPDISIQRQTAGERWGQIKGETDVIDLGALIEPAVVEFVSDGAAGKYKRLPNYSERDFPSSAGGLDGLGTVLLDHVPIWSEAQQRAFRDWLYAGGQLHLFESPSGDSLEFTGVLTGLNEPGEQVSLGSGVMMRHTGPMTEKTVAIEPASKTSNGYSNWEPASELSSLLKMMTQPEHNWGVIFLLALVYLGLLFPGCWLIGRKRGNYLVTYGAILGSVTLFSLAFHFIGRRGYDEQTSDNTVAIVKPTADGRAVITQWTNLFVTGGKDYDITHDAEGVVYSTGQTTDSVRGIALNRPQGMMHVDIPSFSNRSLVHAGVVAMNPLEPKLIDAQIVRQRLRKATLELPEGQTWPQGDVYLFYNDRYSMGRRNSDRTIDVSGEGQVLSGLLNSTNWNTYNMSFGNNQFPPDELFRRSQYPLLAAELNLTGDEDLNEYSLAPNELRLMIYGEMPKSMYAQGNVKSAHDGRALYVFKFWIDPSDIDSSSDEE